MTLRNIVKGLVTAVLLIHSIVAIANSAATDLSVVDFTGKTIQLEKPATRIVALAPHIVENIYSAGAGAQLVGAVKHSDYPDEAKNIERVGGYQSINLEAVVALRPDLVLAWQSGNKDRDIQSLMALGIPVYVDQLDKLEDIARVIRDIGILTGNKETSAATANRFEQTLQQLKEQYQNRSPVTVFYQVWNKPLYSINGHHVISDIIRLCGGVNIYAEEPVLSPIVSLESVLALNPGVIIASGMGEERPEWLDEWARWPVLDAVQKDNLYFVHPDLIQRHTARILEGAEAFCAHLDTARNK